MNKYNQQWGSEPDDVLGRENYVLFVEGDKDNSIDPKILGKLLNNDLDRINMINIRPLGPSNNIRSVAKALYYHHPSYYFLIDRDHQDDEFVNKCWDNFPDPETHNLLVWKRKEIENYFLCPDYLSRSRYCNVSKAKLAQEILKFSQQRLFLDVANRVIIDVYRELGGRFEKFDQASEFKNKAQALKKLKNCKQFMERPDVVKKAVSTASLEGKFNTCLDEMTGGGNTTLTFGKGKWISMIGGKQVLSQVVAGNFQFKRRGRLNRNEKIQMVIEDIFKQKNITHPADFIQLRELIHQRTGVFRSN